MKLLVALVFVLSVCLSDASAQTADSCAQPSDLVNEDQSFTIAFCINVSSLTLVRLRVDGATTDAFSAPLNTSGLANTAGNFPYTIPVQLKLPKGSHKFEVWASNATGTVGPSLLTVTVQPRPSPLPAMPTNIHIVLGSNP